MKTRGRRRVAREYHQMLFWIQELLEPWILRITNYKKKNYSSGTSSVICKWLKDGMIFIQYYHVYLADSFSLYVCLLHVRFWRLNIMVGEVSVWTITGIFLFIYKLWKSWTVHPIYVFVCGCTLWQKNC